MPLTEQDLDQLIQDRALRLLLLGAGQRPIWEASPSPIHQMFVRDIERAIEPLPNRGEPGCACYALADTYFRLPDSSLVRPDSAVLCARPPRQREALQLVPPAVIAIVSPGYAAKDYEDLPPISRANGVQDMLVVDPEQGRVRHITPTAQRDVALPTSIDLACGCRCVIPQ